MLANATLLYLIVLAEAHGKGAKDLLESNSSALQLVLSSKLELLFFFTPKLELLVVLVLASSNLISLLNSPRD